MLAACALAAALSALCLSPDAFAPLGLAPVTGPATVAAAPDVSRRLLPTPAAPDAYDPDGRRSSPDRDPAPGPGPMATDAPDLTGVYRFTTRDFDGKTSAGVAIIERVVDAYSVRWATAGGGTVSGFGLRVGDTLTVTWQMTATVEAGGETVQKVVRGLTLYRVEPGKGGAPLRLRGRWVVNPGDGRVRDEEMVRIGGVPRADGDDKE